MKSYLKINPGWGELSLLRNQVEHFLENTVHKIAVLPTFRFLIDQRVKSLFLYLMVALYIVAGANHFINPRFYLAIMPAWLPYPALLVAASGVCEILAALLLLPVSTRAFGAWFIIAILIAVFPANVQMMINFSRQHNPHLWMTVARLPLQVVLLWWAWKYTK